jgi:hypothetical protein
MNKLRIAKQFLKLAKELTGGLLEPPPAMIEPIFDWTMAVLAFQHSRKTRYIFEKLKDVDWDMVDLNDVKTLPPAMTMGMLMKMEEKGPEKIMREMEQSLKRDDALMSKSPYTPKLGKKFKQKFNTDLTGWRYADEMKRRNLELYKKALKIYKSISVVVDAELNSRMAQAMWSSKPPTLTIMTVSDPGQIDRNELKHLIKHELRHFSQSLLAAMTKSSGGYPSKKIRTPDISQGMIHLKNVPPSTKKMMLRLDEQGITPDLYHNLDDKEFYTDLADAIEDVKDRMRGVSGGQRIDTLKALAGEDSEGLGIKPVRFFAVLRKHAMGKWKKAVSELAKALL